MLSIYKKRRISRALVINVTIETSIEIRVIRNFIDYDTKRCFISQSLATNAKFSNKKLILKRIQIIDDRSISSYNKHQIIIIIYDNKSINRIVQQEFYIAKMLKYDFILSYS